MTDETEQRVAHMREVVGEQGNNIFLTTLVDHIAAKKGKFENDGQKQSFSGKWSYEDLKERFGLNKRETMAVKKDTEILLDYAYRVLAGNEVTQNAVTSDALIPDAMKDMISEFMAASSKKNYLLNYFDKKNRLNDGFPGKN